MNKQDPPFAIQVEPTEGCTLACSFCALQSIRENGASFELGVHGSGKGPYKFMTIGTAVRIASQIAIAEWNSRIEFAMHGEPTVHPQLADIVAAFRLALPKASIMITTNGSGIMKEERLLALFEAGANTVCIDNYKHAGFVERIKPWLTHGFGLFNGIGLYRYPAAGAAGNPHARIKGRRVVIIDDITENTKGNHRITNQGGNSGDADPYMKRCAKPFRELSFRWDGNIAICCDDWPGEYKIGNIHDMDIVDLWNHPYFTAARAALYHGKRDMLGPCSGCNVRTYRNGLLPDHMGKQPLGKPHGGHKTLIAEAQKGKPFTPRVK